MTADPTPQALSPEELAEAIRTVQVALNYGAFSNYACDDMLEIISHIASLTAERDSWRRVAERLENEKIAERAAGKREGLQMAAQWHDEGARAMRVIGTSRMVEAAYHVGSAAAIRALSQESQNG